MEHDFLIVGGGIAGLALGAELARDGSTLVIEAEPMPGMHATGRSAALFTPHFGPPIVRALNLAAEPALAGRDPAVGERSFLGSRGALTVAAPGSESSLRPLFAQSTRAHPIHPVDAREALRLAPLLRPERVAAAGFEPGVMDIDVDALQRACLSRLRAHGGRLLCGERIVACRQLPGGWQVESKGYSTTARTLVNAAGAWAAQVAALAGATPVSLVPKRRTAIVVDAPVDVDTRAMPAVDVAGSDAYFKPEAGRIMASLGDQVPVQPHDPAPQEIDVARTVDWLEAETRIDVRAAPHAWAGLRTFASDDGPVVGFDPRAPGFFWLAGQGGYGIMMALPLARMARSLILREALPGDLGAAGVTASSVSVERLAV